PLNELPADQTIDEDVTLVLSGTKKIQVDNSGTTTKPIDVTLTVSHGTLSQSSFSGSVASVNTALASVTYTPDANYNGEDELVVTTTDDANGSLSDTDTLTITITPVNDAPDAVDDEFETDEDTELHITDSQLLSNDSDVDGDTISVIGTVTPPSHGSVSYDAVNEYWVYTPDPDYTGPDSFTYKITDAHSAYDTATVSLTVNPVNDNPDAVNDIFTTRRNTSLTIEVQADLIDPNDNDIEGDNLTLYVDVSQPAHGTITVDDNGTAEDLNDDTLTYEPDTDYVGRDTFTYTITDGNGGFDTATVTIVVGDGQWAKTVNVSSAWKYAPYDWFAIQAL